MNAAASIGWAILFLLVGVYAFNWDRGFSLHKGRSQNGAAGKPQPRRSALSAGMAMSMAAFVAYCLLMGYVYFSGVLSLVLIVALTVPLALGSLVTMNILWFTSDLCRERNLGKRTIFWLRSLRFNLWHLMVSMAAMAIVAGIVWVCYPRESIGMWLMITAGCSLLMILLGSIGYLGIDTLRFGRGSGRRANRLQELQARKDRGEEQHTSTGGHGHS